MENNIAIQIVKDLPNKKVTIRREFEAPADLVWRAWTESTLLDQWRAPKPWMTKTKSMHWKNVFIPKGSGTTVEVEISFAKEADLQQIIAMGFEAGFSAALGNLDELMTKQAVQNI